MVWPRPQYPNDYISVVIYERGGAAVEQPYALPTPFTSPITYDIVSAQLVIEGVEGTLYEIVSGPVEIIATADGGDTISLEALTKITTDSLGTVILASGPQAVATSSGPGDVQSTTTLWGLNYCFFLCQTSETLTFNMTVEGAGESSLGSSAYIVMAPLSADTAHGSIFGVRAAAETDAVVIVPPNT